MTDGDFVPGTSGYAPVNGLVMYYEIHGTGRSYCCTALT